MLVKVCLMINQLWIREDDMAFSWNYYHQVVYSKHGSPSHYVLFNYIDISFEIWLFHFLLCHEYSKPTCWWMLILFRCKIEWPVGVTWRLLVPNFLFIKINICLHVVWFPDSSWHKQINGLIQDCSISISNALEILQPCTEPSKW